MKKQKIAIMYDFDKTLSPKNMQEFGLIESMGFTNPDDFWDKCHETARKTGTDPITSYMIEVMKNLPNFSKETLAKFGSEVKLYKGLNHWFKRINEYGASKGFEVEHFIISSGSQEMLEAMKIAHCFRKIYACEYLFEKDFVWPKRIVNYTTKTQYIAQINKGIIDKPNDKLLNSSIKEDSKYCPGENMLYIGDGDTDVPSMKRVRQMKGKTIAVYNPEDDKSIRAISLFEDGRCDFIAKADYGEGSELDKIVKAFIDERYHSLMIDAYRIKNFKKANKLNEVKLEAVSNINDTVELIDTQNNIEI